MYVFKDNMLAIKMEYGNPKINKPILKALRDGRAKYYVPFGAKIENKYVLLIGYKNIADKKKDIPDFLKVMENEELTEISNEQYQEFKLLPWTNLDI